jgi:hypothetical protein
MCFAWDEHQHQRQTIAILVPFTEKLEMIEEEQVTGDS